ncbi:hypothetical protein ABK040_010412 [Willaertia magna]
MINEEESNLIEQEEEKALTFCLAALEAKAITFYIHSLALDPIPVLFTHEELNTLTCKAFHDRLVQKLIQNNLHNEQDDILLKLKNHDLLPDENDLIRNWLSETLLKIEQTALFVDLLLEEQHEFEIMIYVENEKAKQFREVIENFVSDDTKTSFNFSSQLTIVDRKFVHSLSNLYGIYHKSEGRKESDRYINISKEVLVTSKKKRKPRKEPKLTIGISTIIEDFLYLGSGTDANDVDQLKKFNIDYILNVTKEWPVGKLVPSTIIFKRIELKDLREENIIQYFEEGIKFIETAFENKKRILTNCVVGKSRSASFIIAFIMKHLKMNLKEAFEYTRARREIIRPNDGFILQLMEFEAKLYNNKFTDPETKLSTSLTWEFSPSKEEVRKQEKEMRKGRIGDDVEKEINEVLLSDDVLLKYVKEFYSNEATQSSKDTPKFVKFILQQDSITKHALHENAHFKKVCNTRVSKWFVSHCNNNK